MSKLGFISDENFKRHVQLTIQNYGDKLISFDLKKFNTNTIDPIKLIFDQMVYQYSWEETVKNEISRQRDKSNNNDIGYFHQRIFQYIDHCEVPISGWDIIFTPKNKINLPHGDQVKTVFVEMKNKHNTMNSASSKRTYMKMQDKLLSDDDCACFLVEVIAKKSQNIDWVISNNGQRQKHRRIRRVSINDIVTGQVDAFYKMCVALPTVIQEVVNSADVVVTPRDTVIDELQNIAEYENGSLALALYMLGFGSYKGFKSL